MVQPVHVTGSLFYDDKLHNAREMAEKSVNVGGMVAPLYILTRLADPKIHTTLYTNSENVTGHGSFRGQDGDWVVTFHGGIDGDGLLTSSTLEAAVGLRSESRVIGGIGGTHPNAHASGITEMWGARISDLHTDYTFSDYLSGTMPDGTSFPLFTVEEVAQGLHKETKGGYKRFGIVRSLETARETPSEVRGKNSFTTDTPANSQLIAYLAGTDEIQRFFVRVDPTEREKKPWMFHGFNADEFDSGEFQARVLTYDSWSAILNSGRVDDPGAYVSLAQDQVAKLVVNPNLKLHLDDVVPCIVPDDVLDELVSETHNSPAALDPDRTGPHILVLPEDN